MAEDKEKKSTFVEDFVAKVDGVDAEILGCAPRRVILPAHLGQEAEDIESKNSRAPEPLTPKTGETLDCDKNKSKKGTSPEDIPKVSKVSDTNTTHGQEKGVSVSQEAGINSKVPSDEKEKSSSGFVPPQEPPPNSMSSSFSKDKNFLRIIAVVCLLLVVICVYFFFLNPKKVDSFKSGVSEMKKGNEVGYSQSKSATDTKSSQTVSVVVEVTNGEGLYVCASNQKESTALSSTNEECEVTELDE